MLRSFNLLKSKPKAIKKKNDLLSIGIINASFSCFKNYNIKEISRIKCFFSSKKNDLLDLNGNLSAENLLIKEFINSELTQNKINTKQIKNDKNFGNESVKQDDSMQISVALNASQNNQENSEKQKKKKPRKRNRKNKKQKQEIQQESSENKISQLQLITEKKVKSFYKILFPQNQTNQQEKILKNLQINYEKNVSQHIQGDIERVQKKQKKKKQQVGQKGQKSLKPIFSEPEIIKVKGLDDLLIQANKEINFPRIQEFEEKLFCILDSKRNSKMLVPFGFRYYLHRFCKYQIYMKQFYSKQEMMKYQVQCIDTIRYYCLGKDQTGKLIENQNNQRKNNESGSQSKIVMQQNPSLIDRVPYMQQFITNLLPFENTQVFTDTYLQVGMQYLKILKKRLSQPQSNPQWIIPSVNSLRMILTNMKRLLFNNCDDFQIDDAKEQDYLLYRTFFIEYLDFFCVRKYKFQTADKVECVEVAKFLKIAHPEFMQFVKQFVQQSLQNFSMVEFLLMLGYLVENKNTPYQYFYKKKGDWMKIIQSSHDFSSKKTRCCIKLLEVFSRQRFLNCEKIYHKLLQIITNNLEAMEGKQLVRTLYFYSRTRYGTNPVFISNLVDKISRWLPYLQQRQFSLLVRSVGNLNYQSIQLVEKLKNINYQKFLCQLKYGCQNLGSYYQEILKEVENQSRRKQYFDGEESFYITTENSKKKQQNYKIAAQKII